MSKTGRRVIDGIKSKIGRYLQMPSPPYGSSVYWTHIYKDFDPADRFEWGELTMNDFLEYDYRRIPTTTTAAAAASMQQQKPKIISSRLQGSLEEKGEQETEWKRTTLGETLQVNVQEPDKSVMILGCGYSKLGEEMAQHGWQKIIQVDFVSKVMTDMSERCQQSWMEDGVMDFIEDDAKTLSAFDTKTIDAVMDKGMIDSLYLADQHETVSDVMSSVHRVLRPNGVFCFLSLSNPHYLIPRLTPTTDFGESKLWRPENVEVRELSSMFLYRCQKVDHREATEKAAQPAITPRPMRKGKTRKR